jgi:tetratricopeptide (TPR) repeat protein
MYHLSAIRIIVIIPPSGYYGLVPVSSSSREQEKTLNFYIQCMGMQFRKFISCLCLFAAICIFMQPAVAISINGTEQDDGTYYYNLCDKLIAVGEFERAINSCDSALLSDTTNIKGSDALLYTYQDKSYAQIQLEKFPDAIDTINQGLSLYPASPILWNSKGYALFKLQRYEEAVSAYNQALTIEKDLMKLSQYYTNKGDALYAFGKYQDASQAYQTALTNNPSNTNATEGLAKSQDKSTQLSIIIAVIGIIFIGGVAVYYSMKRKARGKLQEKQDKKKIK